VRSRDSLCFILAIDDILKVLDLVALEKAIDAMIHARRVEFYGGVALRLGPTGRYFTELTAEAVLDRLY
jgi:DNA-binding MurR/RpiR family transcriptional regulator